MERKENNNFLSIRLVQIIIFLGIIFLGTQWGVQLNKKVVHAAVTANITSIEASTDKVSVEVGKSTKISVKAYYDNNTSADITSKATWTSDDSSVAAVSSKGVVTGKAAGETKINATYQGFSLAAPIDVTVIKKLKSFTANYSTLEIPLNGTRHINLTATYSDGTTAAIEDEAVAVSSNIEVAEVSGTTITALKEGSSTISYTYGSKTAKISLKVRPALKDLAITPNTSSVEVGSKISLKATATYTNGSTEDVSKYVDWSSSDDNGCITIKQGQVTANSKSDGNITIYAVFDDSSEASYSAVLTVIPVLESLILQDINNLTLDNSITIAQDQTYVVTVYAKYTGKLEDKEDVTNNVTMTSSNKSIATVDANGIKAIYPGSCNITYTYGGKTATVKVTVKPQIKYISANASKTYIQAGSTSTIKIMAYYIDGTSSDVASLATYEVEDKSIVTVVNGKVTGLKEGTTKVKVYYGDQDPIELEITVLDATQIVSSLDTNKFLKLNINETANPIVTAIFSDGDWDTVSNYCIWDSSNEKVVTIDAETGTIEAVGSGKATITITFCSVTAKISISVP